MPLKKLALSARERKIYEILLYATSQFLRMYIYIYNSSSWETCSLSSNFFFSIFINLRYILSCIIRILIDSIIFTILA